MMIKDEDDDVAENAISFLLNRVQIKRRWIKNNPATVFNPIFPHPCFKGWAENGTVEIFHPFKIYIVCRIIILKGSKTSLKTKK